MISPSPISLISLSFSARPSSPSPLLFQPSLTPQLSVAFRCDGKLLAAGDLTGTVHVFDVAGVWAVRDFQLLAGTEGGEGRSGWLTWSVATCIGRRDYMEDVVTIHSDFMSIPCAKFGRCLLPELHAENDSQVCYFAVFDGYGGS
ncbi:PPM-type phosphatase domain superfamily [Forsythia ovata]|uniref:PPM-type phosphatase domain superfamily n=1 Tax=Forsythia ovata TaxID=205694 RepID=A0ABD1WPF7_9LAMI